MRKNVGKDDIETVEKRMIVSGVIVGEQRCCGGVVGPSL